MGTRNRMSVARCCCNDECGCVPGTNPDTWTVVLSGIANKTRCEHCADYNGTYTLTRSPAPKCEWEYNFPSCTCCCEYSSYKDRLSLYVGKSSYGELVVSVSFRIVTAYRECLENRCIYRWDFFGYTRIQSCPGTCTCPDPPATYEGLYVERDCAGDSCLDLNNGISSGNVCGFQDIFTDHACDLVDVAIPLADNDCHDACDFASATCTVTANGPFA